MPIRSAEISNPGVPLDINSAFMEPSSFRKPGNFPIGPEGVLFNGGGGSGVHYAKFSEDEFEIRVDEKSGAVQACLRVKFIAPARSYVPGDKTKEGYVYQPVDLKDGKVLVADEYANIDPKLVKSLKAKVSGFKKP